MRGGRTKNGWLLQTQHLEADELETRSVEGYKNRTTSGTRCYGPAFILSFKVRHVRHTRLERTREDHQPGLQFDSVGAVFRESRYRDIGGFEYLMY